MSLGGMFDFSKDENVTDAKVRSFMESVVSSGDNGPGQEETVHSVATVYREKYMRKLKNKYGFGEEDLKNVKLEFEEVSARLVAIIEKNGKGDTEVYRKYLQTYPYMFFDAVPDHVLESRLAFHAMQENKKLRLQVTQMSQTVGLLINDLAALQTTLQLPPIAKAVFEHLPDPLEAMSGDVFLKYKSGMDIYHVIFTQLENNTPIFEKFLLSLQAFLADDLGGLIESGTIANVTADDVITLTEMVRSNFGTDSK